MFHWAKNRTSGGPLCDCVVCSLIFLNFKGEQGAVCEEGVGAAMWNDCSVCVEDNISKLKLLSLMFLLFRNF